MVLPQKTIVELARIRPTTEAELLAIKGFGKTKVKQLGNELLVIIREYGERPKQTVRTAAPKEPKEPKISSITQTLTLYQAGKTVAQIASERGFAVSTIEGHLAQSIGKGELPVEAVLPSEKITLIRSYLEANKPTTFSEVVQNVGNGVTYSEIRYVNNALRAEAGEE